VIVFIPNFIVRDKQLEKIYFDMSNNHRQDLQEPSFKSYPCEIESRITLWYRPGSPSLKLEKSPLYSSSKIFDVSWEREDTLSHGIAVFVLLDESPWEPILFYPLTTYPRSSSDIKAIYRAFPKLVAYSHSPSHECRICQFV
jgi:hypothetical protein